MTYTVQAGDSLWSIAQKFGVTLEKLIAANPQIKDPNLIYPGQVINIPAEGEGPHMPPPKIPRLPEPYPEIRVEGKNQVYARLLHEDYAGRVSETTAIMQYIHHHLEMEFIPGWQEVADLEEGISIVEMGHMEMLGQTIILLGGYPRYVDGNNRPWTPDYVTYLDFDPCAQLKADIQAEKEAIKQYKKHIYQIEDQYIRALLRRIIKDEEYHIQLFSQALAKMCK